MATTKSIEELKKDMVWMQNALKARDAALAAGHELLIKGDGSVHEVVGTAVQRTKTTERNGKNTSTTVTIDRAAKIKQVNGSVVTNIDETIPMFTGDAWTQFVPGSVAKSAEYKYGTKRFKEMVKEFKSLMELGILDKPDKVIQFRFGPVAHYYDADMDTHFYVDRDGHLEQAVEKGVALKPDRIPDLEADLAKVVTAKVTMTSTVVDGKNVVTPTRVALPAQPTPEPIKEDPFRATALLLRGLSPNTLFRDNTPEGMAELTASCFRVYLHKEHKKLVGFKFKGNDQKLQDAGQFVLEFDMVYEKPVETVTVIDPITTMKEGIQVLAAESKAERLVKHHEKKVRRMGTFKAAATIWMNKGAK